MDCGRRGDDTRAPRLTQLGEHVWILPNQHHGCRPTLGLVVGHTGAVAVDGGCSPAHRRAFLHQARGKIASRPLLTVLTHAHWDHASGAADGVGKVLCSASAAKQMSDGSLHLTAFSRDGIAAEYGDALATPQFPRKVETFSELKALNLGGLSVRIMEVDCDHETGCAIVCVPGEGIAFLGDAVYAAVDDVGSWYTAEKLCMLMKRLLALDVEQYVMGHGAVLNKAELGGWWAHLAQISARVGQAASPMKLRRILLEHGGLPDAPEMEEMMWFVRGNQHMRCHTSNQIKRKDFTDERK